MGSGPRGRNPALNTLSIAKCFLKGPTVNCGLGEFKLRMGRNLTRRGNLARFGLAPGLQFLPVPMPVTTGSAAAFIILGYRVH